MQLLFGFSAEDLEQPETFECSSDYLVHEKPSIRNSRLASGRLAPQERRRVQAGWNAVGREATHAAWKKRP